MLDKILKYADHLADLSGMGSGDYLGVTDKINIRDQIGNPAAKSSWLPYIAYEGKGIYVNENAYGFSLEIPPFVGASKGVYEQLKSFLCDQMPEGGVMQVMLLASDRVKYTTQNWLLNRKNRELDYFWKSRVQFFEDVALGKTRLDKVKSRNYRVIFSFSHTDKQKAIICLTQLKSIIGGNILEPQALIDLVDEIINVTKDAVPAKKYSPHIPIKNQISQSHCPMMIDHNQIHHGTDKTSRLYMASSLPEGMYMGEIANLLGSNISDSLNLPCRFIINYTFASDVTSTKRDLLRQKGNAARVNSESWVTRLNTNFKRESAEWADVLDRLDSNERFFNTTLGVLITDDAEHIELSEQTLKNIFATQKIQLVSQLYFQLPALQSILPMNGGVWELFHDFDKIKTTLVGEVIAMLPMFADWQGEGGPGVLLTSRRGQLATFSPFNSGSNFNMCVIAPSGKGKSVLMQDMVANILSQNQKVFVLDIGKSYEKLARILGGNFLEFDKSNKVSLNPFTNMPEDAEDFENAYKAVLETLCIMVNPEGNISTYDAAALEEALKIVWDKHKRQSTITLIAEQLKAKHDHLATILFPYTKDGVYGKFFDGPANFSFDGMFSVVEFEPLVSDTKLMAVVMQMVVTQIMQMISGTRELRFMLVIDEAWRILTQFSKFLDRFARTFRKYQGSQVIVTQGFSEFEANTETYAIWDNSVTKIYLTQDNESTIHRLIETGNLNEASANLLRSVRVVKGHYSEMMISAPGKNVVMRLCLDKKSLVLYSTDAELYGKISKLRDQGMSMLDATKKCIEHV